MNRRSLLAALGTTGSLALAGCPNVPGTVDAPDEGDGSRSGENGDEPYDLGEAATVEGMGEVTVESVTVQRSVIEHHLWREVHEPDDAQVLVVESSIESPGEREITFRARVDGDDIDSEKRVTLLNEGRRYALSVPVGTVDEASVVLEAGDEPAWAVPAAVRERLARPPAFRLHDATVREDRGETVLDLTVENRGERGGTFRGVTVSAQVADGDRAVRFPVPAGETVTETVRNSVVEKWPLEEDFEHDVTPDTRRFAVQYP